jgi:hypothetical protein
MTYNFDVPVAQRNAQDKPTCTHLKYLSFEPAVGRDFSFSLRNMIGSPRHSEALTELRLHGH